MDWMAITKATRAAFAQSVNDWIAGSFVQGGRVTGPNAELTPGSLKSTIVIESQLLPALIKARVPPLVAPVLANELGGAWRAWADGFHMVLPGAYPMFAAVPAPVAPLTPASRPFPLAQSASAGEQRLLAATLIARLYPALRSHAGREVAGLDTAVKDLATWVEASFREWKTFANVVGLMGKGTVPTFAPPYVPVGSVVLGDNMSTPGKTIAGPRFGKLIF